MSANLYWEPPPKETRQNDLPDALRYRLAKRLWEDNDGTLSAGPTLVGPELIPYLQGLLDGDVAGAKELIAAIEKHGSVLLTIAR